MEAQGGPDYHQIKYNYLIWKSGLSRASIKNLWRHGAESNRRIRVLQTPALPLGYRAA